MSADAKSESEQRCGDCELYPFCASKLPDITPRRETCAWDPSRYKKTTARSCPFCGMREWHFDGKPIIAVVCTNCGACGPDSTTEAEALSNWDGRTSK